LKKYYYGYNEFLEDIEKLSKMIADTETDTIVAIARGGLTPAHFIAEALNTHRLYVLNSIHYDDTEKLNTIEIFNIPDLSDAKEVVLVDDIIDSGDTVKEVLDILGKRYPGIKFKTASLFYKTSASIKPDFSIREADSWIDFMWTADTIPFGLNGLRSKK
jgi:xanthine phosphoribosyltransferase